MPPLYYLTSGIYFGLLHLLHIDPLPSHPIGYLQIHHYVYPPLPFPLFGHDYGPWVWVGLLLLKVPNLVAVAVGYWGLVRLAPRLHLDASYLKWLWLASPVVVAVSLIQGQLDIMPAAITVWAMVFFKEDRPWASLVCLGLAAGFKDYALLLIPITALYLGGRDILKVLAYGVVGALPFWPLSHTLSATPS